MAYAWLHFKRIENFIQVKNKLQNPKKDYSFEEYAAVLCNEFVGSTPRVGRHLESSEHRRSGRGLDPTNVYQEKPMIDVLKGFIVNHQKNKNFSMKELSFLEKNLLLLFQIFRSRTRGLHDG